MVSIIALSLIAASTALAQDPGPALGKIETLKNLSLYIEHHTGGAVRAVRDHELSFKINELKNEATPILPSPDPDLIQSLFVTDVEQMIKNAGTVDFVSAKKKFYASQKFNWATQRFSRPYIYPSDWKSLNHNPVRTFNLPPEVYGQQFKPLDDKQIEASPLLGVELHNRLDEVTGTEMTAGNDLRLLNNGMVSFAEKLRMVRETKHFFHSVVMVQYCDQKGAVFVDALIEKAKEGKDIRLIAEGVWTKLVLKTCLKKLRDGGVKVTLGKGFFNPKTLFTVHHTKFWVRDGEEAIIGGQNMHDHENLSNGFNNKTRDKDVHVTGPIVTDLVREYVKLWNKQLKKPDPSMLEYLRIVAAKEREERVENIRGPQNYETWLNGDVKRMSGLCRVLVQGTKTSPDSKSIIAKAYLEIIKNMKYSMFGTSPTFRYSKIIANEYSNGEIVEAIEKAAHRGVKVDMISNGVDGDFGEMGYQLRGFALRFQNAGRPGLARVLNRLAEFGTSFSIKGNREHLERLAKAPNVDAWLYFNHTHSKQLMFDNILTTTGSFNLDKFSYRNHESTMICLDKKLADESMLGFISDIVNSTPVL